MVSLKRISQDFVLRIVMMKCSFGLTENKEVRHGPADGVIPVFTP